ncbi:hypothetical protein FOVSG1_013381 [Fusarium oxysporum f. sp. vasinfectum]
MARLVGMITTTNSEILQVLKHDSEVLARIQDGFHTMLLDRNRNESERIEITCFYEELPLPGIGLIVPQDSAVLPGYIPISIPGNHMEMTKFLDTDDPGFLAVCAEIRRWIRDTIVPQKQSNEETDLINAELQKLSRPLRQKLKIDRPYNKLRVTKPHGGILLDLPIIGDSSFETRGDQMLGPAYRAIYGSSSFELAAMLQLLPGQTRNGELETETLNLENLFHDEETYYCSCSSDGLLRFVTQHFVNVQDTAGHLVVNTDVGAFTFLKTDRRTLVRYNGNNRRQPAIAPQNQDFDSLKMCAAGKWCLREGDTQTGMEFTPGQVQRWVGPLTVDGLLWITCIDHKNCLYFLSQETYLQVESRLKFARALGTALGWLFENSLDAFRSMDEALETKTVMDSTKITKVEDLPLLIIMTRRMLADAMHVQGSERAGESRHQDGVSGNNMVDQNPSLAFVERVGRYQDELFKLFENDPSHVALQTRLLQTAADTPDIVAGQLGAALLVKGNAEFILHRSIPSPALWLELLTSLNGYVFVG